MASTNAPVPASSTQRMVAAPSNLLKIDRLTTQQRHSLLRAAAEGIVAAVVPGRPSASQSEADSKFFQSIVMGVFVTLKRGEVLRGCCGVLGQPMELGAAIRSAAVRTAKEDRRMAPISPVELPFLNMDVTLLGPFIGIDAQGAARAEAVQVGRHGLMIQRGEKSGLLLPSVAQERGWDAERFLQAVCGKAGLPLGAWQSSDAKVMTFEGHAVSSSLSELLPDDLPQQIDLPLSSDQLRAYAQVAGQNIVAMVTGGTPSYVLPHLPDTTVNALVLSMQWESSDPALGTRQGSALQVSFRPGVPLQSTLYQMCQQAAHMFQQQRFNGQLLVGLTLGFDPALHGTGQSADLAGVDPHRRALVISDARHCGFALDPERNVQELRDMLREELPVGSRDANLHSLEAMSTMPSVVSVSAPSPVPGQGARPAAVAGKFYPAEDAARRSLVDKLFSGPEPTMCQPLAIMVPHAGLKYSGQVAAKVWRSVENLGDRSLVIVSPKHTTAGINWSVCPFDRWRISNTLSFESDVELARQIAERVDAIEPDAAAHQQEHGIEVQLPLLERLAAKARIVGVALRGGGWADIQRAASQLADVVRTWDPPPLLVISSDMNHYAPDAENRRRDRLALDALASGDPQHLLDTCQQHEISMCGVIPAALVMETLRQLGREFQVVEVDYATSADVSGDKSQVVGYAGAVFLPAAG